VILVCVHPLVLVASPVCCQQMSGLKNLDKITQSKQLCSEAKACFPNVFLAFDFGPWGDVLTYAIFGADGSVDKPSGPAGEWIKRCRVQLLIVRRTTFLPYSLSSSAFCPACMCPEKWVGVAWEALTRLCWHVSIHQSV
jgi:hypothetical protein